MVTEQRRQRMIDFSSFEHSPFLHSISPYFTIFHHSSPYFTIVHQKQWLHRCTALGYVAEDWNDWADCSNSCGNGTSSRERHITVQSLVILVEVYGIPGSLTRLTCLSCTAMIHSSSNLIRFDRFDHILSHHIASYFIIADSPVRKLVSKWSYPRLRPDHLNGISGFHRIFHKIFHRIFHRISMKISNWRSRDPVGS